MVLNSRVAKRCQKTVVANSTVLSRDLRGGPKPNHKKPKVKICGMNLKPGPPEYEMAY